MNRMLHKSEWQNWICADIETVLKLLDESYGSRVSKVHLDMKSAIADVYLVEEIPAAAFESISNAFASNPNLRFVEGSAVCLQHYCSIQLAAPAAGVKTTGTERGMWEHVRNFINRVLTGR